MTASRRGDVPDQIWGVLLPDVGSRYRFIEAVPVVQGRWLRGAIEGLAYEANGRKDVRPGTRARLFRGGSGDWYFVAGNA